MSEKNTLVHIPNVDHKRNKNKSFISGNHEDPKSDKPSYSDRSMPNSQQNKNQSIRTGKYKIKKRRNGDVAEKAVEMKRLWETARRFILLSLFETPYQSLLLNIFEFF